jgi:DNA-binding XRE family transcriptional regulator
MTQAQCAEKIGVGRALYAAVENGSRNGTLAFWEKFKNAFDIPESEIWRYTQNDED